MHGAVLSIDMYGYLKKPKLLMIAGSLALPEQIWKKEIIFITHIIPCKIGNAIQPRNGIIRTNIDKIEATSIFSAYLTWNIAYFDELVARSATIMPIKPMR